MCLKNKYKTASNRRITFKPGINITKNHICKVTASELILAFELSSQNPNLMSPIETAMLKK